MISSRQAQDDLLATGATGFGGRPAPDWPFRRSRTGGDANSGTGPRDTIRTLASEARSVVDQDLAVSGQDADWRRLRETYAAYGIVLALGAGVSKGAGTPDWTELLTRIEAACRGGDGAGLVRWLLRDGYSLLYVATALQETCTATGEGQEFAEVVRAALYRFRGLRVPAAPDLPGRILLKSRYRDLQATRCAYGRAGSNRLSSSATCVAPLRERQLRSDLLS
jgi:hypothetical protein